MQACNNFEISRCKQLRISAKGIESPDIFKMFRACNISFLKWNCFNKSLFDNNSLQHVSRITPINVYISRVKSY